MEEQRDREETVFFDDVIVAERCQLAVDCAGRLRGYLKRLRDFEQGGGTDRQLAEKAYEAERYLRMGLYLGLDSLNELIDSGRMETIIGTVGELIGGGGKLPLEDGLQEAKGLLAERFPGMDTSVFDEAVAHIGAGIISAETRQGTLLLRLIGRDGQEHEVKLGPKARPGHLGRIGAREFFGAPTTPVVLSVIPLPADEDSHHDTQRAALDEADDWLDLYGGVVHSFAIARETMYRHARMVDEQGRPHATGKAPLAVAIIVLAVVAVVAITAGVLIQIECDKKNWTGSVCDWGKVLIVGGVIAGGAAACLASGPGGCTIVVGVAGGPGVQVYP